ncbi:Aldos-2-ulose dehydratase [Fusarium austroafricanum]|uniref:Aldos-2-ulose dehydratase n=1 Tax=Fusarium austroafricanum TaxID=2364996 RepID=A0A8H4P054_9HYPO|nr:Aldos-2-ulose dehydratase [Fusarium austroafricanum]
MAPSIAEPTFGSSVIEDRRQDGYWVETFHFDKNDPVPGIITSGLVSGEIEFIDNPIAIHAAHQASGTNGVKKPDVTQPWTKHLIGKYDSPVAVVAVDITNNGLMDLVICHDYGPFMLQCNMQGGWVSWLENPGRDKLGDGLWKERKIGRWPAMHRMKAGSFLEVVAASVVRGEADKVTPIPIIRFQRPENVLDATEWPRSIIDDEHFTVIHEVTQKKFGGPDGLDSMIISSREGTTWLHYEDGAWKRDLIGIGEPKEPRQIPNSLSPGSGDHWGTGCADVGKVGDDPFAYIATLDPFHGISACVYTKTNRGLGGVEWKRHVLDTYGTPNQRLKRGDGPGHYIVCADFDGDGDDEFLLALFGPLDRDDKDNSIPPPAGPHPLKGIMYYKPIDLEKGLFAKWRIADESSARIAIGNFGGAGKLDLVSIGYNVKLYYEEPKPVTTLHLNQTELAAEKPSQAPIVPTAWDNEGLVYLARPDEVKQAHKLPLIEVANYAISVEVHPKNGKIPLEQGHGIKVLYGSIHNSEQTPRKPLGNSGFPTIAPVTADDGDFTAGENTGAIVLRLVPVAEAGEWAKTEDVPVKTTFELSKLGLGLEPLKFRKVEELWYGAPFKGKDFWNMSGFHFRFSDDKSEIAHMQFWTAGTNVDCGLHNHSGDIFEEIHVCLSLGTGNGGMSRLIESKKGAKSDYNGDQQFEHVALPRLHEHGGMWYRDSYGNAIRDKENAVSYPYHKWQAGSGPNLDIWMALEFNPDLAL